MAFPADYTRLIDYTLPTITGSHTDFVMLLKYDDFNVGDALNFIDNGGGDLRFSSDESGANQLPCEVVEFDKVGNSIQVSVKVPNAATGQVIYIWGDNTGDSQPAVTDPYGRNAVWSDYVSVYSLHDNSGSDSAGNNNLASAITSNTNGKYGTAQQFGTDRFIGSFSGLSGNIRRLSAWVKVDNTTSNTYISTFNDNETAIISGYQDGAINAYDNGYAGSGANSSKLNVTQGQWHKFTYVWSGGRQKGYLDGNLINDVAKTMTIGISDFYLGGSEVADLFNGAIQGYQISNTELSADREFTEYDNQSSVGAWGVPTRVGGGEPETHSFSCVVNFSLHSGFVNKKATNQSSSFSNNLSLSEALTKVSNQSSFLDLSIDNQLGFTKGSKLSSESGVLLSKSFVAVKESNIESKVFTSRSDLGVSVFGSVNKGSRLSSLIELDILEDGSATKTASQTSELGLEIGQDLKSIKTASTSSAFDLGVDKSLVTAKISSQSSSQSFNLYSIGSALGENIELNKFSFKVVGDISTPTIVGDISIRFD